jgi:hypothetical protein
LFLYLFVSFSSFLSFLHLFPSSYLSYLLLFLSFLPSFFLSIHQLLVSFFFLLLPSSTCSFPSSLHSFVLPVILSFRSAFDILLSLFLPFLLFFSFLPFRALSYGFRYTQFTSRLSYYFFRFRVLRLSSFFRKLEEAWRLRDLPWSWKRTALSSVTPNWGYDVRLGSSNFIGGAAKSWSFVKILHSWHLY